MPWGHVRRSVAQVNESWDCQSSGDFIFCNIAGLPWIFLLFKCETRNGMST